MNDVLAAKKALYELQQRLLQVGPVVIHISLNLPGGFQLYPWEQLFARAVQAVENRLASAGVPIRQQTVLRTANGPHALFTVQGEGLPVKQLLVELEETSPVGRLWDLDVLTAAGPVDRAALGLPGRRCLLCAEEAHVCRLLQRHPQGNVIRRAQAIAARVGELW